MSIFDFWVESTRLSLIYIRSFSCIKFVDLQGLICLLEEPNYIIDLFKGTVSEDHIKGVIFKSMIFI